MKSKTKILIVDDNRDSRRILRELLMAEGFDAVVAGDGEEGLSKARTENPDLVITDILLPVVDGFRLLREIKQDPRLRNLPVIFYTGSYLDLQDKAIATRLGASRYLTKPVASAEVISTIREVMAEKERHEVRAGVVEVMDEPVFLKQYNERLVSKLKNAVVEGECARQFLDHIMESVADGMIVIDRDYTIIQTNSAAAASVDKNRTEIIGGKCYEILHHRDSPCETLHTACPHQAVFERGETVKMLHTHYTAQGNERYVEITASPVKDGRMNTLYLVETHRDIMEKKIDDELVKLVKKLNETQVRLKQMTITDELTGIRNRRYIVERLEEEFQRARRSTYPLSIIMLDIDHFKRINDEHGHLFGDVVLRIIASRIKSGLRKHDLLGRVGGEEFLIICPESGLDMSIVVAQRIRGLIGNEPIGDRVTEVSVTLSAGVTVLNDLDRSADAFFSRADCALYKAKEEGRDRVASLP